MAKHQSCQPSITLSRSSRAASAPPEFQQSQKKTLKPFEHRPSLPPSQKAKDLKELDMISKLKLASDVKADTTVSLRSTLGEEEEVARKC